MVRIYRDDDDDDDQWIWRCSHYLQTNPWLLHPFPRTAWGWITQIAPPLPTPEGSVGGCCCKKAWDLWFENVWSTHAGDYNHWVDPQIPPPNKKKSRETIVLTIQIWTKPHRFSLAPWDTIPGYPVSSLGQNAVHLVLATRMRTNQDGVCHGMSPNNVWVQKIREAYQSYHTQIYYDILSTHEECLNFRRCSGPWQRQYGHRVLCPDRPPHKWRPPTKTIGASADSKGTGKRG